MVVVVLGFFFLGFFVAGVIGSSVVVVVVVVVLTTTSTDFSSTVFDGVISGGMSAIGLVSIESSSSFLRFSMLISSLTGAVKKF